MLLLFRARVNAGSAVGGEIVALGRREPTFVCDSCAQRKTGTSTTSITGRRVCADCSDQLTATAAAMMSNPENPVGEAIAITAWLRPLRTRRRARRAV